MADHTTRGATPAPHVSPADTLRADIDAAMNRHSAGHFTAPTTPTGGAAPELADPLLPGLDMGRPLDVLLHKLELLRSGLLGFRLAARSFEHHNNPEAKRVAEMFGGMFESLWYLMPGAELTEAAHGIALDLNDTASTGAPVPLAVGGFFGLADDDAVTDVACGRAIIRKRTGLVANTLFARADVLARVANSAAVKSYLPPTQAEPATTLQMEAIFGVQRIAIVDSLPTDLGSNGEAIGTGAVLAYVAPEAAAVHEAEAKQGQRARKQTGLVANTLFARADVLTRVANSAAVKQTGPKAVKAPARKAALSHA